MLLNMKKPLLFFTVILLTSGICSTFGCSGPQDENIAFNINVIPEQLSGSSIARQQCVFLVTITNEGK
jgi:hypothetical protein